MTKIHWMEKVIELNKFINMSDILKMMDRGPVVNLWTKDSRSQKVRLSRTAVFLSVIMEGGDHLLEENLGGCY